MWTDSASYRPLSARPFQSLGDDLLASTFNGATANQVTVDEEMVIAHSFDVVCKIQAGWQDMWMLSFNTLTGQDNFLDLTLPEHLGYSFQPISAFF